MFGPLVVGGVRGIVKIQNAPASADAAADAPAPRQLPGPVDDAALRLLLDEGPRRAPRCPQPAVLCPKVTKGVRGCTKGSISG
eukprot:gene7848-biopygen9110